MTGKGISDEKWQEILRDFRAANALEAVPMPPIPPRPDLPRAKEPTP